MSRPYLVWVNRFGLPIPYRVNGHTVTSAVARTVTDDKGKKVQVVQDQGPTRLELWLTRNRGVVIYGDISRIKFRLGRSWFKRHGEEVEAESAGAVKLVKD